MKSITILYASMTGNTEEIAEIIESYIEKQGIEVKRYQIGFDGFEIDQLFDTDGVLIGTYTDGDGDLPFEAEDIYDAIEQVDLKGIPFGLFGSCDSMYTFYGGAIDSFETLVKERGANVVVPTLKIELYPEIEDIKTCETFAQAFIENSTK
ncbi:flavodoxin domain-containing protein [Paraliobacillus salinarum]|uniref:flavodoxin domain-containing protein n=1 Tax=Paraliobacillus salinarum TaxID=1158996 RepID=UPI0015F6745F|nr:flavodoxin domain-containing protein [Paraliobacillus salinarum]